MICNKCGATIPDSSTFCADCGAACTPQAIPTPTVPKPNIPHPGAFQAPGIITEDQLPAKFKPMGAWSYFGHSLLFSIPIVGLVFLIVYALGGTANVNKRNFARSYFCVYLLGAIIGIILLILALILGLPAKEIIASSAPAVLG